MIAEIYIKRFLEEERYKVSLEKIDWDHPLGIIQLNQLADEIFLRDELCQDQRNILGNFEDAANRVKRAVINREFPSQNSVSWENYTALLSAASYKEEIARSLIEFFLLQGKTFGLYTFEKDVLLTACRLGATYDELCLQWRNDVVRSENNALAKEKKLLNQYTVIIKNDKGELLQIPYRQHFKDKFDVLIASWQETAKRIALNHGDNEAIGMAEFLMAYVDALNDSDLKTVEESWRGMDRVWMKKVVGSMQPIVSREYSYYDPNSLRVFPDFRLCFKVSSIDEQIKKTQTAMEKYLGQRFAKTLIWKECLNSLKTVGLYAVTDLVYCGCLDFQPAGESLPNEDEIQRECGTKSFLWEGSIDARWQLALDLMKKVFPKDIALFENVSSRIDCMAIQVAGHEYGEPLFTSRDLEDKLGMEVVSLLNEDLANLCITAILPNWIESGELESEALQNHAFVLLGTCLRYIDTAYGVSFLKPYYVGICLLGLRRMFDSGFIRRTDEGWSIHQENLIKLYELSASDLEIQVSIAETKSLTKAQQYLSYAVETEEIKNLISFLKPGVEV